MFRKKILTCGLIEGIKAGLFMKIRPNGSSMAKSYDYLKILSLISLYYNIRFEISKITFFAMARASRQKKGFAC